MKTQKEIFNNLDVVLEKLNATLDKTNENLENILQSDICVKKKENQNEDQ